MSARLRTTGLLLLLVLSLAAGCTRGEERRESSGSATRGEESRESSPETRAHTAADRWEPAIQQFEQQDKVAPPPPHGIVFVGSSSIVRWDVGASFPGLKCINRGFGGSYMEDVAHYADRVIVAYHPRVVVVYAGDNDLAHGKTAADVAAAAKSLASDLLRKLPDARIIFISIKPSLQRWHLFPIMQEANRQIATLAAQDARIRFVDVTAEMLGPDGKPRPDLFVEDGLHMTAAGYALWASLLRPELEPAAAR